MKTNFTKRLLGVCRQALIAIALVSTVGISQAFAQTCTNESNTTLDEDCTATITLDAVSSEADIFYSVTLNGVAQSLAADGMSVVVTAPGTYTYQVDDAGGCWGTFNVEDKTGPVCTVPTPAASTDLLATKAIECNNSAWATEMDVLTAANFNDCSDNIASVYFVDQSVTGCEITNADTLGMPLDGTFDPMGSMICAVYKRTWYAVDGDGNVSEDACSQYVFSLRAATAPIITTSVTVECTADAAAIASAIAPKLASGLTPAGDSISLTSGTKVCKYIATVNSGDKLTTCGNGYKQINTWTVIDWCSGTIVASETQLLIVEDSVVPTTTAKGAVSFAADPFDCSGIITVGAATGSDNCTTALSWITSVRTSGVAGYGASGPIESTASANGITVANVAIGDSVFVSWTAVDDCNNQSVALIDTFVNTTDNRGPVAICNDELNVSLVAANATQQARVYAEDLDDTSRDNCGITNREVSLDGTTYTDYVTLGCDNIGTVVVYLKVSDAAGNTNVCWTNVTVEDKSVPVVEAPADVTITCLDEVPAVTAPTIVAQGCTAPTISDVVEANVGISCGNDVITRTWTVTPPSTGAHAASASYTVSQTITVTPAPAAWTATFPADVLTLNCGADLPAQLKIGDIITDTSCNDWLLQVDDEEYTAGGDVCKKVIRTYTLLNWCTVENPGKTAAIVSDLTVNQDSAVIVGGALENLQTYGKFSYSQTFKISDSDVPTADIAATIGCDESATTCNGGTIAVAVTNTADNCGTATITSISLAGQGVAASDASPADGAMTFTGLAAGEYTLTSTIVDECGNISTISTTATVIGDCKKPTPVGVVTFTALMENDSVDVWVSDIERSSSDNCTDAANLVYGIELLSDVNGDGVFTAADASAIMPTAQAITLTCDKLASVGSATPAAMLALWVKDEAGNTQVAIIPIGVTDNDGTCTAAQGGAGAAAAIAGRITNEDDEQIDEVMVKFESSNQSLTEQLFSGLFNYSVPMHTEVTITPEKDLGYMNGVTTADLVKLQRHILGITQLSSAYQMIAADVNSDERVNTKDMLQISRLILGLYDELPNSASWKFVAKDYTFSNPSSPWGFPQAVNYKSLESDVQADFIGVKIGDVSGNASPSQLLGDDNNAIGEMTIAIDDVTMTPGVSTVVEFKAADFTDFAGYQFTISLGDNVELTEVTPGVLPNMSEVNNFALNRLSEGTITTSWSNANGITLEDGAVLFSLTIESSEAVNLSEVISINSKQTAAEAYNNDLDVHTVGVQFNSAAQEGFQLFQNQPNPFNGETVIGFNMPTSGAATLKVMNVAGQVLTVRTADFVQGYNQISLNKSELNASGVLYYQIETENHSATKKMIILE